MTMESEVVSGDRGETILVVEDGSDVRAYVVKTLRNLNYQVLEAPDATFAIARVSYASGWRIWSATPSTTLPQRGRRMPGLEFR